MARVAVVDNDPGFLDFLAELLEMEGHEVEKYTTAAGALTHLPAEQPDLLIVDGLLGGMTSGWEFLQVLRSNPRTAHIPLIVCSGDVRGLRANQDWLEREGIPWLEKPFDIDDLFRLVNEATRGAGNRSSE